MIPDLFPERQRSTANFIFYGASLIGSGAGMAIGGGMLHWLSGSAHELPLWLAGIDTWRLAMMMVAMPGPLLCPLVPTMPLGDNSDRLPAKYAAAGGPAMIGCVP